MLRSSRSRAQTEPIAAIVAVSIFALALGLYAVSAQGLLPGTSHQVTADQTIDRVWHELEDDGLFHAHDNADDIEDRVTNESLPAGDSVAITVTAIDEHEQRRVAWAAFPPNYNPEEGIATGTDRVELEAYLETEGVPDDASVATQSIPVAVENEADVRSGTLRVSVW
ncbi:hypothetical protein D8Y22_13290 [Salinadaptatus halalkaliphilus]|uniref:Uncharacterized protein n=1 Tax=Salinadaptatus halalkaliphilus TaxID=2419781 RepID=A0A4S3TLA5_9EURY|nr:hypothetical protein [Salinadaptatus halalkaliphilus]THE64380.1 hypothetical protein D8Y22_13290 [Salinadaptatus halalkaliphilus]